MPFVDEVANRLSHQMIGNGVAVEAVVQQELPAFSTILDASDCLGDIEVVAPAG